ncbi:YqhA family protein [Methanofollis aquaemaris]|uniref:YqhA family protein n=1 Tax=Methanofollis aquaemaris TaxID=126734 RepID=A0A8A3S345_9EURY|nr:YqhA family protein [Methanofollis aquaemaris]
MDPQPSPPGVKDHDEQSLIERTIETCLWNSRFIVLLAVVFGILSAVVLFISGSIEVVTTLTHSISIADASVMHEEILIGIVGAIDFYLIGVVLLIFSFGIYELFISKIDIARKEGDYNNILEIYTLDDLKSKIIKVIIMVLIVSFFQRVLTMEFNTSQDMLFMALSILAISLGVYFMHKHRV